MIRLVHSALDWIDASENVFARWLRAARAALLGEMTTLAAGTALFAILATVPTLAAVVAIYSYASDPNDIRSHLAGLETVIPQEVVTFLQDQLERASVRSHGELGLAAVTSLAAATLSARGAAASLINVMNRAYRVRDTRGTLPRIGLTLVMAFASIFAIVISLAVIIALPGLAAMSPKLRHSGVISWIRWPTLTMLLFLAAGGVYRFAPSPRPMGTVRYIFSGSICATVLLLALSWGLSTWVDNVADYSLFYGAFGSVVVLLLWFFLAIIALVVGGFVNAELERHSGAPQTRSLDVLTVIDTHCHLDLDAFDRDRDAVLARAAAAGVTGLLVPAIRPRTWAGVIELARTRRPVDVRGALGVHPQIVPELAADELPRHERGAVDIDALVRQIVDAIDAARDAIVAVGECGLDGATADRDAQEATLRAHVRAARALGLPLVIHVLRAHDAAPRILREERAGEVGGVLHSYSGGAELVPIYRDLGLAFSLAGPVTYANARRPVEAARAIPAELLLAETDAPDQAPAPHRGGRSEPAFVAEVIAGLAAARGVAVDATRALVSENARRMFRAW